MAANWVPVGGPEPVAKTRSTAGLRAEGNIDLHSRPRVKNADGTISTVRTISIGTDEGEVLIPTVSDDGRVMSNDEAIQQYRQSGRHLGIFDTPDNATAYAHSLHDEQDREYSDRPAPAAASKWQPVGQPEKLNTGGFHVAGVRKSKSPGLEAAAGPQPQEEQHGVISSLARGVGERIGALGGGLAITAGKAGDAIAEAGVPVGPQGLVSLAGEAADRMLGRDTDAPRPGLVPMPKFVQEQVGKSSELLQGVGGEMTREGRLGYKPMTTPEDIKGDWRKGEYLSAAGEAVKFGLEQGVVSLPDMAAVLVNFPAYLSARSGEIAQERARVDGRDTVTDQDMAIGTATAAITSAMERYGAERVLGQIKSAGTTALRRILGAAIAEATTEAGQEGAEYVGERVGQQPMSVAEGAERAGFGALGGGVAGAAIRTTVEGVDKVRGRETPAPAAPARKDPAEPAPVPGATKPVPKVDEATQSPSVPAERYQLQRTRGELLGRQYEIRQLTEADFQYLIKPSLPKGHANTLDEYLEKHPTVTHVRVERSPGQADWRLSKAGPVEVLRPDGAIARAVDDFDSKQAREWAALDGEKTTRVDPDRLDVENDSILTAIAKLGGVSRDEAEQQGIDPKSFSHRGHRISPTFRRGGLSFDQMAEALAEFGYPVTNAEGNYDANVLLDMIDAELGGKRQRSNQSSMSDEIAKLEQRGAEAQAPAEPITIGDLVAHYSDYPGAIEDDTEVPALHEPEYYPPEFDAGARKLADLAELAQMIDPTRVESALQAGSDADAARQLWAIVNGDEVDATSDEEIAGEEVAALSDDIGEVAAANVQAGQEQSEPSGDVLEGRPDGGTDSEVDDEVDLGSRPADEADLRAPEPVAARPEPASSTLPPPQDKTVGATPGERSFKTSKGSTYVLDAQGRTTRDKAQRPEHRDHGKKPRSDATYFVSDADSTKLMERYNQFLKKRSIQRVDENHIGVRFDEGKDAGKFDRKSVVRTSSGPVVGQSPVETWADGKVHFGNEITEVTSDIDTAANEAATSPTNDLPEPTDAQKEAGNYAKGHVRLHGMQITIENPAGSLRRSKEGETPKWVVTMPAHYGYIRGTVAADGEQLDVTLGPKPDNDTLPVFVFDQGNEDGSFDEHKVFLGFSKEQDARFTYKQSFAGNFGKKMLDERLWGVRTFENVEAFKEWANAADLTKPASGARRGPMRKGESLLKRDPTGGDQVKPDAYASGMSRKGDLKAAIEADTGVGVVIHELSQAGLETLADAVAKGKHAFVDSGAFNAFMEAMKQGRSQLELMDFEKVFNRYDQLSRQILARTEDKANMGLLMLVAPDVVGDQTKTLELLEKHKDRVTAWIDAGHEVVVPFQKGPLKQSEVFKRVGELLGGYHFVVGIPSNAEALSAEDLHELLRQPYKPDRLHILGAVNSRRMEERMQVIREEYVDDVPGVTADANLIRSKLDKLIGLSGQQRIDAIKEILGTTETAPKSGPWGDAERSKADPTDQRTWWEKEMTSAGRQKLLDLAGLKLFGARIKWDVFTAEQKDKLWSLKGQEFDERERELGHGGGKVETVQEGEKGQQRYRTDKALKKYLLAKRPRETETERIISYRTETVLGVRKAMEEGAPHDIVDQLRAEYEWALAQLEEQRPETDWRNTLKDKPTAEHGKRWDALGYGATEKLAQSVYSSRKVVHRIASSKWEQLSYGEQSDMAKAMRLAKTPAPVIEPDESEETSADADAPATEQSSPAVTRELPRDNYRGPLSRYAKTLYRETDLEGLRMMLGDVQTDMSHDRIYVADTPDLAMGQGSNKGVLIEFDAEGLEGTINLSKPTSRLLFEQGSAEYIAVNHQPAYTRAIRRFTVKKEAEKSADRATRVRFAGVLANLTREGWTSWLPGDGSYIYSRPDVGDPVAPTPAAEPEETSAPTDAAGVTLEKSRRLADWVKGRLAGRVAITWEELFKHANFLFGGTQAEGVYTPKDAYDAIELGVNLYLRNIGIRPIGNQVHIDNLARMLELLPTQTKRTAEQEEFQQFSTPPHYAYVAVWAGAPRAGEQMLEPSAGLGGLAVFARNAEAKVTVNELSPRRAALLKEMGFDRVFTENAEQLNNVLPKDVEPTLIVMNPPFSATAGRMQGARSTAVGGLHVSQALKRLAPGGRLVAIVGQGMAEGMPATYGWWRDIKREYDVRANIGVDGDKVYRKYGTTFGTQLLVIDKRPPRGVDVITGNVKDVSELLPLLEGIRNDRPATDKTDQPAAAASAERSGDAPAASDLARSGGAADRGPDAVGARGGRSGADRALPGPARPGSTGELFAAPGAVQPAEGTGLADIAAERERRALKQRRTESGEVAQGGGAPAAGSAPRSDGGDSRVGFEQTEARAGELTGAIFEQYTPQRVKIPGAKSHPGKLVQSSAMASVMPPPATYKPDLPKDVIEKGLLSDAQLEMVIYAGQAHEQVLKNGDRRGYFIGDGTGVGKGREISGIILDNLRHGRTKAIWVSEKQGLLKDAKRDFSGVGADAEKIFWHGTTKAPDSIKNKDGVMFTTYATLRSAEKKTVEGQPPRTRLAQAIEWFGKDYDGVIVFDESHNAGNAVTTGGKRGATPPSAQALAIVELQKQLPNARIVYVSATGATELHNLSYATRLGIWGDGTPFADVASFISQVGQGGLAAMELVARDLKQMGSYAARSLSYDGVTYERLQHNLTEVQREIYDELAMAWQTVLGKVYEALELTKGNENRHAKTAAMSAFWGSHQRFFNQVITSMQMPSVIEDVERRMARGEAIVMQLVNTNEAIQERKLAAMGDEDDIDDLDMTPNENLIQYIKNSFPVVQYEEFEDERGNKGTRPALDSEGKPILNREAVEARDALIAKVKDLRVPEGPLELVINQFGTKVVAEVTGRRRRVVRDEKGKNTVEPRGRTAAQADAEAFMADKKRILIFSDAGGTGFSFQADLTKKNQRKRAHYLVQPGWRANKAVQGFGRTHRTNQAVEPEYVLVTTDLAAQKRFISSIARRLDQLGALTKGQRDTANQGLFSASDNLESEYAEQAVYDLFVSMAAKLIPGLDFEQVTYEMGLNLIDEETKQLAVNKIPAVPKFLNRLLSLTRDRQEAVFNAFNSRLENLVAAAIADGTFDAGMETLEAQAVDVKREEVVYTDEKTGAQTKYVELELTRERYLKPFPVELKGMAHTYYRNKKSGRVWVTWKAGQTTDKKGKVEQRYRMVSPTSERAGTAKDLGIGGSNYEELRREHAQQLWDAENQELGPTYKMPAHLITGAILPIWDRLEGRIRVVRTQSQDGRRFLGRLVDEGSLQDTLKRLNVDASYARMKPAELIEKIKDGQVLVLANRWEIFQSTVSKEKRIELRAPTWLTTSTQAELIRLGVFMEKIQYKERYFIPAGAKAADAIASIVSSRPVVDIIDIEKSNVSPSLREGSEQSAAYGESLDAKALKRIRDRYTAIASRWKGFKGRVIVRFDEFDVPRKYRQQFIDNDQIGKVAGFVAQDTGDIYLLPGNWSSESDGERTLFHEAEGHLSIAQFFGEEIVPYLNRVYLVDPVGVKRVGFQHGYYDENGKPTAKANHSESTARVRSADEYVASMAETINSSSPKSMRRMWNWLVSHWAEMMRAAGWRTYRPSEAEIRGFLQRAQSSFARGGRDRSARANDALERKAAAVATRLSKKSPQQQLGLHPSWNSPEPTRMDSIIHALQDRHIDSRRVIEAISEASASGVVAEDTNVYLHEELFHGRVAKRVQDFLDDELRPLLKEMQDRKLDMFEVNRYLHARHARERNEQIASINADMPDGGSGMMTEEAETYLNGLSPDERRDLDAVARMVDVIIDHNRSLLVSYGLESVATIDIWQQTYSHYVPLNREDMDTGTPGTGQGFSVRGPSTKRAFGSDRAVNNILASIAQQREKFLVRGEKNRVANALLGLALENPNNDFWKVDAPPMIRYQHPQTGMVEEMLDPNYKSHDNIVTARVPDNNGNVREHVVVFNKDNERALRMSKALKNLDVDQLGVVFGFFAKITRWFASINTQYNPIFGLVNVYRDLQEGLLNLTSTPLEEHKAKVFRYVVPALRGIYIETRDRRGGNRRRSAWADLWDEFQREGGQTGYRDMFSNNQERAEAIAKEIKEMTSGNPGGIAFRAVRDWLTDYNIAMENGVRLATYRAGIEAGLSKKQAASVAKNLTVNFNRKGAWGLQAGSLYAFFNASVQGTARIVETLKGPTGKKIIIGGMLVGVIQALMMAAFDFDEEDIPEFVQSNNLVLPIPGTDRKYLSLPYPLGFRFLPNIGRIATQYVMSGFKEAPRRVTDMLGVVMDNFNPIGNAGWSGQTISPTAADPAIALFENRDWTGQPIAREDRDTLNPTPGHTRAKANSSSFSVELSRILNLATGGTEYVPGIFSPTPDQIDYLIGQATGGVGRESLKTWQSVESLFTGEQLPSYKIPLLGRLYGTAADQAGESRTFYNNVKKLNRLRTEIMGRAEDGIEFDSVLEDEPVAALAMDANRIEKMVSDLRREKRRLQKSGAGREDIQQIDEQITSAMAEINRLVADMEKGQ